MHLLYICTSIFFWIILKGINGDITNCPTNLQRTKYLFTYQNTCLQIVTTSMKWKNARKDCRGRGGDLVQIYNAAKQNFLVSQLKQLFPKKIWIGATDKDSEGKWIWVSGQIVNGHYENWESGQGTLQRGFLFFNGMLEDCALLDYGDAGKWHDYMCNSVLHRFPYICQYHQIVNASTPSQVFLMSKLPTTVSTKAQTVKHTVVRTATTLSTTVKQSSELFRATTTSKKIPTSSKAQGRPKLTFQPNKSTTRKVTMPSSQQSTFPISMGSSKSETKIARINTPIRTSSMSTNDGYTLVSTSKRQTFTRTQQPKPKFARSKAAKNSNTKGIKGWVIGVIIGSVVFVGVIAVVTLFVIRKRRNRNPKNGIDNPVYGVNAEQRY